MKSIKITLPDKSVKVVSAGTTSSDIASSIGPRLADAVLVARQNGVLRDLSHPITEDCDLELLTGDTPDGHGVLLHSAAHLMAQAVKYFWPEAKLTIGPAVDNKFYYDFDISINFTEEDLMKIEKKMKELSDKDYKCIRCEMSRNEAYKLLVKWGKTTNWRF